MGCIGGPLLMVFLSLNQMYVVSSTYITPIGLGGFCCHYGVFPCWVFSVAFRCLFGVFCRLVFYVAASVVYIVATSVFYVAGMGV